MGRNHVFIKLHPARKERENDSGEDGSLDSKPTPTKPQRERLPATLPATAYRVDAKFIK
jgi:hypothetical protein